MHYSTLWMASHLACGKYVNRGMCWLLTLFYDAKGKKYRLVDLESSPSVSPEERDALRMESDTWALLQLIMPYVPIFIYNSHGLQLSPLAYENLQWIPTPRPSPSSSEIPTHQHPNSLMLS